MIDGHARSASNVADGRTYRECNVIIYISKMSHRAYDVVVDNPDSDPYLSRTMLANTPATIQDKRPTRALRWILSCVMILILVLAAVGHVHRAAQAAPAVGAAVQVVAQDDEANDSGTFLAGEHCSVCCCSMSTALGGVVLASVRSSMVPGASVNELGTVNPESDVRPPKP